MPSTLPFLNSLKRQLLPVLTLTLWWLFASLGAQHRRGEKPWAGSQGKRSAESLLCLAPAILDTFVGFLSHGFSPKPWLLMLKWSNFG